MNNDPTDPAPLNTARENLVHLLIFRGVEMCKYDFMVASFMEIVSVIS